MSTSGIHNSPIPQTSSPTSSTASSTSSDSSASMSTTFMTLLTQELQNQDPTAPMDSTQMVGQMISLNQLSQLTSINQLLSTQFGAGSSTSSSVQSGSGS